ncbi:type IV pilin protein [Vibrio palustris]|uniref:Putative major pilin subunit n=2 Tax=Vibrio palustris TaxID=1918946 RepID=A0A1R4B159_9VIBR|nr:type IV pilin protein [Vibrio palustris]SJL82641.1 putative major pilin subunit [Vibrio palustris]
MILKIFSKYTDIRRQGMTLLEVLLVISIIGIVSALAYPSYTRYVLNNQRQQVIIDMARIQLYLDSQLSVSQAINAITNQGLCDTFCRTPVDVYQIHIEQHTDTYLITAFPQNKQKQDTCQGIQYRSLLLRSNGEQMPKECW